MTSYDSLEGDLPVPLDNEIGDLESVGALLLGLDAEKGGDAVVVLVGEVEGRGEVQLRVGELHRDLRQQQVKDFLREVLRHLKLEMWGGGEGRRSQKEKEKEELGVRGDFKKHSRIFWKVLEYYGRVKPCCLHFCCYHANISDLVCPYFTHFTHFTFLLLP